MATTALFPSRLRERRLRMDGAAWRERGALLCLSGLALLLQGFHPFAEDGGLYLAGVEWVLDPRLFAGSRAFLLPHLRYSIFAPVVAGLVRGTGLPLVAVVFALHLLSLWTVLLACSRLAEVLWAGRAERRWAVGAVAVGMGLPVAGTSLSLGDPYLTARSFAVPLVLLSLGYAVAGRRRAWVGWAMCMAGAAVLHPLVAATGMLASGLLWAVGDGSARDRQRALWRVGLLAAGVVGGAAVLQGMGPGETASSTAAALSRSYWFLGEWRWFEVGGVVAPVVLLPLLAGAADRPELRRLVRMGVALALLTTAVAVLFAREGAHTYTVARLQPMRAMQVVYFVFVMALGAALGRRAAGWRRGWRWVVAGSLLVPFAVAARLTFPATARVELPGVGRPGNAWEEAFLWARGHTERDALFALDADYISRAGEDAEGFRALAERSSLPDWSKDGGEASITPSISRLWQDGVERQRGLSEMTDAERRRRLLPAGVTWMVLEAGAKTAMPCPFRNTEVMVCRMAPEATGREGGGSR